MLANGRQVAMENETPLSEFLKSEGYDAQRVAVEKNGKIVPKKMFESEILSDRDRLEIVSFVGGG